MNSLFLIIWHKQAALLMTQGWFCQYKMIYADHFSSAWSLYVNTVPVMKFNNSTKVKLLVLFYACKELNNGLKFMFVWYDMAYHSDNGKVLCFSGMIQHTLVIKMQNFVFLWYDTAYLSDNGAKCCLFYGMI